MISFYNRPMLIDFFLKLKSHKLPVFIKEYLTLLEAMDKKVIGQSIDEFYYLSRIALVKDEANFDKLVPPTSAVACPPRGESRPAQPGSRD